MKQQYIDSEDVIIQGEEEGFSLKRWFFRMLHLWPVFLISLLVCLFLVWLYLRYTNPVYEAVASIMVKDEKKGAELMDNSMLKEIGLGGNSKLVENEIEVLKSYDLMEAVVNKLQLFVSVSHIGRLRDVDVFADDIPFSMEILNPENIKKTMTWSIQDTTGGVLLKIPDVDFVFLPYNVVYRSNDLHFRFMPAVYSSASSKKFSDYKVFIDLPESATDNYSMKLSVDAASKVATVINLGMKDHSKKKAAAILQSLIDIYNQQGLEDKNRVADNTIDFLNDRLVTVSKELQGVEGTVERFKSENKVTDLSTDAQQYLQLSQQIDVQKAQSETQLNIIDALERNLKLNQDDPKLVPSTLGIEEPTLGQLIEKHNQLVLQKERAEQRSGPKNPLLIDLNDQIAEIRSRLLSNVANLRQAYAISLDDISRRDAQLNYRIRNVPLLEKKLVQITRNQNVQEQLYAYLLQKREEAALSRASNVPDSRTILKARSLGAISPKKNMVWTMGLLLGFILPIGFISIKEFLNNKIGDIAQIERHTSIPVLGVVSHVKKLISPVVINTSSRSAVAEQIRNIRTSIGFTGKGKEVKTILVTSFQPGDGKSFISLNLAASYALLDKKTVILEFDLRKPNISKSLEIKSKDGISSILSGRSNPEKLLIPVPEYNDNLYLLPAGYLPPNPAELISGSKMGCLIKILEENFDYIIIDTPPFSIVTDAVLLQRYADVSLIVLRQDHTSKDVYTELKYQKNKYPDHSAYILLNDVGKSKRYQNGYGYGGYYDRGKGYYSDKN